MVPFNSPEELESTLEVARTGDLLAFERIMRAFEAQVFRYIMRMVSNQQDAEDLTQEVFIKLYKNLPQYQAERGFKTWLFTIATNTVYDFLRRKRNIGSRELTLLDDPESHFEPQDERATYIHTELSVDIERALEKIKPGYRAVLLLFYKEDLSCEEIGRLLKMPENTVKTQLRRAREAMKNFLDQ